jgi:hypothetical protein
LFGLAASLKLLTVSELVAMTKLDKRCYDLMRKFWHGIVQWPIENLLLPEKHGSPQPRFVVPSCPVSIMVLSRREVDNYLILITNPQIVIRHLRVNYLRRISSFSLPSTLKSFHMFKSSLPLLQLPSGLQSFRSSSDMGGITALPPNLKVLDLHDASELDFATLPESLTELAFSIPPKSGNVQLPPYLTSLQFGCQFNSPLPPFPLSLTTLTFHDPCSFKFPLPPLPLGLLTLKLPTCFDELILELPSNLIHLTLGDFYNQPLPKLPASLTFLRCGASFEHEFLELPANLTTLHMGNVYMCKFPQLPESLKTLSVAFDYPHTLPNIASVLTIA